MAIEEIKRIIKTGNEEEKNNLRDYFKKYGNTLEKEEEIHEILVDIILQLNKSEIISLSSIIGYPVFLRISLMPKIRHKFPLLQDGASLILLDNQNRILVQQRMDNGKYGFSGGCQELGEELTDVAIRECYEETGLLLDKNKIIDVCEVSGLSRKNSYPNGDVVVNNTALHIGYLEDCTGALRKDYESKQLFFEPLTFFDSLKDEEIHDKDFVPLCRMFMEGKKPFIQQPLLEDTFLPFIEDRSFIDYLYSLTAPRALTLAKKMGYQEFLKESLDPRIRNLFPHLVDKIVLISIAGEKILTEEVNGQIVLPKRIQSVGESFENVVSTSFGVNREDVTFVLKLSGNVMYNPEENEFINAFVFETNLLKESNTLKYRNVNDIFLFFTEEDKRYYEAFMRRKEEVIHFKSTM